MTELSDSPSKSLMGSSSKEKVSTQVFYIIDYWMNAKLKLLLYIRCPCQAVIVL